MSDAAHYGRVLKAAKITYQNYLFYTMVKGTGTLFLFESGNLRPSFSTSRPIEGAVGDSPVPLLPFRSVP